MKEGRFGRSGQAFGFLGDVMSLVGGFCSLSCSLLMPAGFHLALTWRQQSLVSRAGSLSLLVTGLALLLLIVGQSILSINSKIHSGMPCPAQPAPPAPSPLSPHASPSLAAPSARRDGTDGTLPSVLAPWLPRVPAGMPDNVVYKALRHARKPAERREGRFEGCPD